MVLSWVECTKRREGERLRGRIASSVLYHRAVKEDNKCEVSVAVGSVEVISEMQTLLVTEVRGVCLRSSDTRTIIHELASLASLPSLESVATPL